MSAPEDALAGILRRELAAAYKSHIRGLRGYPALTEEAERFADHTAKTLAQVLAEWVAGEKARVAEDAQPVPERAMSDPADQRLFLISAEQMEALQAALDRPTVVRPRLAALLAEASMFVNPDEEETP